MSKGMDALREAIAQVTAEDIEGDRLIEALMVFIGDRVAKESDAIDRTLEVIRHTDEGIEHPVLILFCLHVCQIAFVKQNITVPGMAEMSEACQRLATDYVEFALSR